MIIFGKITGAIIAVDTPLKAFCLKCDQITGITDEVYKPMSRKVLIEKSKCKRCSRIQRNYRKFVAFSPENYRKSAHFGKATRYSKMSWTTLAPEVSNFTEITPTVVRRMVVSSNPRYILHKTPAEPVEIEVSNVDNSIIAGRNINIQTGGIIPRIRPGGPAQQNPFRWRPGTTTPPYAGNPFQPQAPMQQPHRYYNSSHSEQPSVAELTRVLESLRETMTQTEYHNAIQEEGHRSRLRERYLARIRAMSAVQRRSFLSQEVHPSWCMCQRCEGDDSNA